MATYSEKVGKEPTVTIHRVVGDLTIETNSSQQLELTTPDEKAQLNVEDGLVGIRCESDSHLILPTASKLIIKEIGGEARIGGLSSSVDIKRVGGNLTLYELGGADIEAVGGGLSARNLRGNLSLRAVGGDMVAESIAGDLKVGAQGGELIARDIEGEIFTVTGGDVFAELSPGPGANSTLRAGGDMLIRLPADASLKATIQAGGELLLPSDIKPEWSSSGFEVLFGEGEAEYSFTTGGDIALRQGEDGEEDLSPYELGDLIASRIADKVADASVTYGSMALDIGLNTARIADRVQRMVNRAVRSSVQSMEGAFAGMDSVTSATPDMVASGQQRNSVSDEERLMILRMVEAGTLSVEEAEGLLEALEKAV